MSISSVYVRGQEACACPSLRVKQEVRGASAEQGEDIDTALTRMKIFWEFGEHERNAARHLDMACSNKHWTSALNQTVLNITRRTG